MTEKPPFKMYTIIRREPEDLRGLIATGWQGAEAAARLIDEADRLFLVGIGTSYHAAVNAEHAFRLAGCDARAVSSYDFVTFPPRLQANDAVLVFSHRGTKRYSAESIARARAEGSRVVVVTGVGSPIQDADVTLRTVAPEESAAFTASHTAATFVTAQVAFALGKRRGTIDPGVEAEFARVPGLVQGVIDREEAIVEVARYALDRRTFAAGAGPEGALATEVALKAREAAYTTIDGLPTEQFIHGPMVTVNADDFAILFATVEAGRPRTRELLAILDRIGTRSWVVGRLPEVPPSATLFELEEIHPILAPVVGVVPLQLFACYQAQLKGTNADSFRRDLSPWSEAFALIKL